MVALKGVGGASLSWDGAVVALVHRRREVRVPVASIQSVEFKPVGGLSNGWIRFVVSGGEQQRVVSGTTWNLRSDDPFTVIFGKNSDAFARVRDEVEAAISGSAAGSSDLDLLKTLFDHGVLTRDEFVAAVGRVR
jgi:hypothetical protein